MNGTPQPESGGGITILGKLVLTLLVVGVVGVGGWKWYQNSQAKPGATSPAPAQGAAPAAGPAQPSASGPAAAPAKAPPAPPVPMPSTEEVVPPESEPPALPAQVAYVPKGDTIDVEISAYAGYAGLVAANGGVLPGESSVFFRKHGFKVRLKVEESEGFDGLQSGKTAASATTADVLPVLGRRFFAKVPVMFGYSRGADALVVRSDIKRINDLKGKVVASVQFLETDFLLRYLVEQAGLKCHILPDLATPPDPEAVNVVYCGEVSPAATLFLKFLRAGHPGLAGFVGWAPDTTEAVEKSGGKARILAHTKDLLVVADVLVVNKGFAEQNPKMVAGLVDGILEGNRLVAGNPDACLDVVSKAFAWTREKTREELTKVHLCNLPENLAFFRGSIESGESFGGIYQSSLLAYGPDLLKDVPDSDKFADLGHLTAIEKAGTYKDERISIEPSRPGARASVENAPLLAKDIRFQFEANQNVLDMANKDNLGSLDKVKGLLRVAPGSVLVLRGHVSAEKVPEFKAQGDSMFRKAALAAIDMSKKRANAVKQVLVDRMGMDETRIETEGKGWDQPLPGDYELSRRVEILWFTLE
jgi:NitT/TauT family transport system substrate-binding protein